jgi:CubicO group peptidase (beta-lactamase class C family)
VAKYINELVGTDSESVTIRNILSNDSGRFWNLVGDLLVAADPPENLTEYAIARGQQYEPGTAWQYNQMAIQCLDRVLSVATGQSTASFAQEYLFDPLGMTHTTVELDELGQMIMSWGIQSTGRDMACLGSLYLSGGEWDNEQLLSQEYIKEATSPSNDINPAYGYLWWLNAVGKWYEPVTLIYHEGDQAYPDAPLDVYVASGFMGQIIMVSPSDKMVIVRQGHDPLGIDSPIHNSLYRGIAAALN